MICLGVTGRRRENKLYLALQVTVLLGLARAAVLLLPFRWIDWWLNHRPSVPLVQGPGTTHSVKEIRSLIARIAPLTPWRSNCLARSLAGRYLLQRRGVATCLYLGVNRKNAGQINAHAWLRSGGVDVTGTPLDDEFCIVAEYEHITASTPVDPAVETK